MCGSRIAGIAHHYMPIRIEKLTGAFRPLCIGQPSHRLPACVSALRVLVSSGPSLHQSSHSAASFSSREGRKPPDRPEPPQEAVAGDADIAAPKTTQPARPSTLSEPLDLSKQDSKSAAKGPRPLSASPYVLDDSQHLIKAGSLPGHAWPLLTKLHLAGHDVFVVGGTVRDLLLNREPKDLDLITTASLHQVRMLAHRCRIVGQRHPIALVPVANKKFIEVSTFQPSRATPSDAAGLAKQGRLGRIGPDQLDKSWATLWQHNMQQRDFTLNALMYDPFSHLLFDYVGGVSDCSKRRLQCCKDPTESFHEDPHRMLRAVRLAGRCDLKISPEVEAAVRSCAPKLISVSGSRLFGEAINLFCHGTSLRSIQLLWRLHLLDVLMPPFAEYARMHKIARNKPLSDDVTTWPLLLRLLNSVDKQASVERPVSMTVVAAVLVVPLVVDTIAAHRAELENIISKASESLSKKTARRLASGFDRKSGSQAVSATTLQDAVLRWEEKLHDTSKASTAVQQHVLMTCIIDAAAENVRTRLPEGLLPRASVSAIRQMLLSFYGTLTQQTQEDGADQDTQHTASHTEKSVVARRDRFANSSHYRQMTVIFHQAESHWQQLLL